MTMLLNVPELLTVAAQRKLREPAVLERQDESLLEAAADLGATPPRSGVVAWVRSVRRSSTRW